MCEIFPEVTKCCFVVSLRIGMLFISVLAIMTGVTMICGIEKVSNASFHRLKNVTNIRDPTKIISYLSDIIPSGITTMACLFMMTGLILLFSTLTLDEHYSSKLFHYSPPPVQAVYILGYNGRGLPDERRITFTWMLRPIEDNEGFAQIFVWLTFLAVMIGFIMVAAIALECIMKDKCLLSKMDWLSGATLLVVIVAYLFLWIYFISVANSYVVTVHA